jgi:hypothetical protein
VVPLHNKLIEYQLKCEVNKQFKNVQLIIIKISKRTKHNNYSKVNYLI